MGVVFLAIVLLVLLWWALHQREYLKGKVDRPFFSWGRRSGLLSPPPTEEQAATYQRKRKRSRPPATSDTADELQQAVRTIATYTHNQDVAVRLLREALEQNPGKPMKYCVARALEKLMRDRRA